jgi:anti-sigma regulatory factor (Ser/Thr protein kinase)
MAVQAEGRPIVYDTQLHAVPEAIPDARARVTDALRGRVDPSTLEDVALLTSELVTNSVRHAGVDPDRPVALHVEKTPSVLRVAVVDEGPGFERRPPRPRADSGWGLYLVERISDRWGVFRDRASSVWFEIDL